MNISVPYRKYGFIFFLFFAMALFSGLLINAQTNNPIPQANEKVTAGISFTEDPRWDSVLQKAAGTNKLIFVDANASWCVPCKLLKTTTFKDQATADFFNQHFINLSIDMEKGEGPDLAAKWAVDSYPTLIIFNSDGSPVLSSVGYLNAKELLRFGKQALEKSRNK